jgi:hypothetical protein
MAAYYYTYAADFSSDDEEKITNKDLYKWQTKLQAETDWQFKWIDAVSAHPALYNIEKLKLVDLDKYWMRPYRYRYNPVEMFLNYVDQPTGDLILSGIPEMSNSKLRFSGDHNIYKDLLQHIFRYATMWVDKFIARTTEPMEYIGDVCWIAFKIYQYQTDYRFKPCKMLTK